MLPTVKPTGDESPISRLSSPVSRRSRRNCVLLVMVNGRGCVVVSSIRYGIKQTFDPVNHVGQFFHAVIIFVEVLVANPVGIR